MTIRLTPYLDDDLVALAEMTARFAEERVAPGYVERDATRVLDRAISAEMGELGLIAPELPTELGEGALSLRAGEAAIPERPDGDHTT